MKFCKTKVGEHGNKIDIAIASESGNSHRDDRHDAVKAIIEAKLNQLNATHLISVHPGLTDIGAPRSGTLG